MEHIINQRTQALIDQIFREEYDTLVHYAYYALYGNQSGDKGRAEEVVQEAIIIALTHGERFSSSPNPRGWLMNAVRNKAQNMRRQELRIQKLLEECYYAHDDSIENKHGVHFTLSGLLPPSDLQLLEKLYLEGYTYQELQDELQLSSSAFAMRVSRIKSKFIKNYELECEKSPSTEHDRIGGLQKCN